MRLFPSAVLISLFVVLSAVSPAAAAAGVTLTTHRGSVPHTLVATVKPTNSWPYAINLWASRADVAAELHVVYQAPWDLTQQHASSGDGRLVFQEWRLVGGRFTETARRVVIYRALAHGPVTLCSRAAGLCVSSNGFHADSDKLRVTFTNTTSRVYYVVAGAYRNTKGSANRQFEMSFLETS